MECDLSGNCFRIDDELYGYSDVKTLLERITELEAENKILSDSIMAGTNVYKRQLKNAETESSNRGRALKEIIRLASEYTTSGEN